MRQVSIHEAKTHLSRLIYEVSEGRELVIAKAGRPVAKLVPVGERKRRRRPGFLKGKIKMSRDFDAPLSDELLDAFEGKR